MATGAAVVGANVVVKDSDAATADVATTTSATGTYSADVSGLKAPFVVIASGVLKWRGGANCRSGTYGDQ